MRKNKECIQCQDRYREAPAVFMKRVYIKIGSQLTGVAWICPNYPNMDSYVHREADEGFDWGETTKARIEQGKQRTIRGLKQQMHGDIRYTGKSCFGNCRRIYIRTSSSWKTIGWFCLSCKGIELDQAYRDELTAKKRDEMSRLGIDQS